MPDTLAYDQFVDQPFQTTVRDRVTLDGIGLHSGRFVELSICPAPANTGIKFRRIDIDAKLQTVAAHAKYAEQARLCTRIVNADGILLVCSLALCYLPLLFNSLMRLDDLLFVSLALFVMKPL